VGLSCSHLFLLRKIQVFLNVLGHVMLSTDIAFFLRGGRRYEFLFSERCYLHEYFTAIEFGSFS